MGEEEGRTMGLSSRVVTFLTHLPGLWPCMPSQAEITLIYVLVTLRFMMRQLVFAK